MEKLSAKEISKMAEGTIILGDENYCVTDVVIDSREANPNSMFVALKGEQTDGHRFVKNAYDNGVRLFLISDKDMAMEFGKDVFDEGDSTIILAKDSLFALQNMSGNYLRKMGMRCIAVTGSVGKTTTRDMLFAAMSSKYKTGTNKKNYNSETGLPLTLLSFTKEMEVGVLEMGMDAVGQIERLAEIAEPEAAVITNIGISHIERLGSRENIFRAKMEVTSEFDSNSTLVVNADDDMLVKLEHEPHGYNLIKVGTLEKAKALKKSKEDNQVDDLDYIVKSIIDRGIDGIEFSICRKEGTLGQPKESMTVKLSIPGSHNAINCALAIAGAQVMGVSMKEAVGGIKKMKMTGSRLRILTIQLPDQQALNKESNSSDLLIPAVSPGTSSAQTPASIRIIDDAYNAAPASVKSALATLSSTVANRRIAMLGGINELGDLSEKEHRSIGEYVADCDIDVLVTIGEMASWIGEEAQKKNPEIKLLHFEKKECLYPIIKELLRPGDVVLIKASRSFELDKLAEEIARVFEGNQTRNAY